MAAGVIHAATLLGAPVPGKVSVAGLEDISLASQLCPTLTTVHQPFAAMAERAATVLIRRTHVRSLPPDTGIVLATLVLRESTGPASR